MAGHRRSAIFGPPTVMGRLSGQKPPTRAIDGTPTTREDLACPGPVRTATRRGAAQDRETAASVPTSGVWGGLVTAERAALRRGSGRDRAGGFWPNGAGWR